MESLEILDKISLFERDRNLKLQTPSTKSGGVKFGIAKMPYNFDQRAADRSSDESNYTLNY